MQQKLFLSLQSIFERRRNQNLVEEDVINWKNQLYELLNSFSRDLRVLKKFREGKLFAKIGDLKSTIRVVDFKVFYELVNL